MSGTDRVSLDVPHRHVDCGLNSGWMAVHSNGEVIIIYYGAELQPRVYQIDTLTTNPRVIATADAILHEGSFKMPYFENGLVLLKEPMAGANGRFAVDEFLDDPVPVLDRVGLVKLEGVGGRVEFECIDCGEHIERDRHQLDIPGMTPQRCSSCTFELMGGDR